MSFWLFREQSDSWRPWSSRKHSEPQSIQKKEQQSEKEKEEKERKKEKHYKMSCGIDCKIETLDDGLSGAKQKTWGTKKMFCFHWEVQTDNQALHSRDLFIKQKNIERNGFKVARKRKREQNPTTTKEPLYLLLVSSN